LGDYNNNIGRFALKDCPREKFKVGTHSFKLLLIEITCVSATLVSFLAKKWFVTMAPDRQERSL
jgi:hypothetical protein